MTKPTYAVRIVDKRRAVGPGRRASPIQGPARADDGMRIEFIRASNRREAVALARARHPDHDVLDDARRVVDSRHAPSTRVK